MLDTDICIHLIKHRPQRLINRFDRISPGDVGISTITLAELEYGAAKSSSPEHNRAALAAFISPLEIVSFGQAATPIYGRIRAHLERKIASLQDCCISKLRTAAILE
jgi:tRNA(fMet)-specific endonuclease VapC